MQELASVNALEFLSVSAAVDGAVAKSSMERAQREAGARFEERGGWLVPVSIPAEEERRAAVGIADLSHLAKLEVRPAGEAPGDLVALSYKADTAGLLWYPVSRRRALCFCRADELEQVRAGFDGRLVLDVTGALSILALVGPQSDAVLRRLTHLHRFPSGGEVAHITAHVLRPAEDAYWIVCAQEYGHYLWQVAVDVARPLGGGPIGVGAL